MGLVTWVGESGEVEGEGIETCWVRRIDEGERGEGLQVCWLVRWVGGCDGERDERMEVFWLARRGRQVED